MSNTKYIVTTNIGRTKKYIFGTGKTSGNLLLVEYSTIEVDAERFDTAIEAKAFLKQISNPFQRQFAIEPVVVKSFEAAMADLVINVDETMLDKKAELKKVKKLK